jgi:hypothetical protein
MNLVIHIPVVNGVVEREVVKHGLFAFLDLPKVGIHRPIPGIRPGNTASLRAGIKAAIAWTGGTFESWCGNGAIGS